MGSASITTHTPLNGSILIITLPIPNLRLSAHTPTAAKPRQNSRVLWGIPGCHRHCVNTLKCLIFHSTWSSGRQQDRLLALEVVCSPRWPSWAGATKSVWSLRKAHVCMPIHRSTLQAGLVQCLK